MIESLYRPCEVILEKETLKGTFHCWEYFSKIVAPSLLKGGHAGGQILQVFGIVEFEDGSVKRVQPYNIKFVTDELILKREKKK